MFDSRLNHLVAVAKCGSFTAAAQSVGVTQSAVTKSVADLERQMGFAIFHRTARGALLTEHGRDFVERAARLLDDARELLEEPAVKVDPFAGVLRVGVCPASLDWRLIEPVAQFRTRYPRVRLDLNGTSFERMAQQLRNGAVDVAIGFDDAFREWPDVHREPIGALPSAFFVRRGHPLLVENPITAASISSYEFVSPSDSRPYGATIRNVYESQGVDWRKQLHVIDCFPLVKRIVAESDAISVVARSYAASPRFQREFTTIDDLHLLPPAAMCCAVRARWEPSPSVRALISTVRQVLYEIASQEGGRH